MARISLREDVTYQKGDRLRVEKGVVYDAKICGLESANGRRYRPEALKRAVDDGLYEGVKSNINHPAEPGSPTPYQSRFGRWRGVNYVEGDGVRGNYHFNPEHAEAKSFIWWCENDPAAVGFSHNADGELDESADVPSVTSIVEVHFVDLVADPATTGGVFENRNMKTTLKAVIEASKAKGELLPLLEDMGADYGATDVTTDGDWKTYLTGAIATLVKSGDEASHKLAIKIMKLLKNKDDGVVEGGTMESLKPELDAAKVQLTEAKAAFVRVNAQLLESQNRLETYQIKEAREEKERSARKLCKDEKLPKEGITELFIETLVGAKDEAAMKAHIEERKALLAGGKRRPVSAGKDAGNKAATKAESDAAWNNFKEGLPGLNPYGDEDDDEEDDDDEE